MQPISALRAWLEAERDRLPLWLPVFMCAGVLAYYSLRFEPAWWCGAAAALTCALAAYFLPVGRIVLVPMLATSLGFAAAQWATARAPPIEAALPSKATTVTGIVTAVERLAGGRRVSIADASLDGAAPLRRFVRVRLRRGDATPLGTGDAVRVRALLRPPAMPAYPGAWDLQRDAFYTGLGASGFALGDIERTGGALPLMGTRLVQRAREEIAARVTSIIPGTAGEFATTLLTGASMAIPEADHEAFRVSGLAHLLAVAGLHIGIIMAFILAVARLGFALNEHASLHWPTKKLAVLAALAAGAGYMVLTGMHVPILRSFAMAVLFSVALMADRQAISLRGLAVAGVLLMAMVPQEVPGVSFQMSFSAVAALIAGYEAMRPWLSRLHGRAWWRRLLSHCAALALTSALAGSASAPYGAYHFGHFQVYFVLANMLAVPLTALWVMPAGVIALCLMPLHLEALALVPMGWGANLVVSIARWTADLPAATLPAPPMPAWGLAAFSFGLAWLCIWRGRRRLAGVAFMAAGILSPFFFHAPDVLVSADSRLLAVRTERGVFLHATDKNAGFTADAWRHELGVESFLPMPDEGDEVVSTQADGRLVARCQPGFCKIVPFAGDAAVLVVRDAEHQQDCRDVAVVVSLEPARGLCPKPWPALVDRFTAWRNGSTALWLDGSKVSILTDRAARGDRPWVPPPPKARPPPQPALPSAMVDGG